MVLLSAGKEYFLNIYTKESQWDPPTEAAERNSDKVQSSHLLVKHRDSRRPSNYKGETITRSKEEAIELLKGMFCTFLNGEKNCSHGIVNYLHALCT